MALLSESKSAVAWFLDNQPRVELLEPGAILPRFIRNTNITPHHDQGQKPPTGSPEAQRHPGTSTCYAHAAVAAYLNTIARIPGARPPPSFKECFEIADYNPQPDDSDQGGGFPNISIQLMENHFHYGICCEVSQTPPLIKHCMTMSVILRFTTNKDGWDAITAGNLLKKTSPEPDEIGHAVLIEGYDLEQDAAICLNSWDAESKQRFNVKLAALHGFKVVKVFFTLDSIHEKTTQIFRPVCEEFLATLDGKCIRSYWMNKETAIYASTIISEPEPWRSGELCFRGYNLDEFIEIKLKRPIGWFAALLKGGNRTLAA
jgi:hypothetical protein